MAKVQVSHNCGCGYKTENIAEAVLHSDSSGHSLDVVGRIIKDRKEVSSGRGAACQLRPGTRTR